MRESSDVVDMFCRLSRTMPDVADMKPLRLSQRLMSNMTRDVIDEVWGCCARTTSPPRISSGHLTQFIPERINPTTWIRTRIFPTCDYKTWFSNFLGAFGAQFVRKAPSRNAIPCLAVVYTVCVKFPALLLSERAVVLWGLLSSWQR